MATPNHSASATNPSNPQRMQSLKTFLASDQHITIIPSFTYKSPLNFLITQSSLGPFHAGIHTSVPLWLAIYLRKRNLCRIVAPTWMNEEHLKQVLQHEKTQEGFSTTLPFRYMEISRMIFQTCGISRSQVHATSGGGGGQDQMEEIPNAEQVRILLEDIATVRMDKIRTNVHELSKMTLGKVENGVTPVLDVTGIGSAEMTAVKPFLEGVFEDHLKFIKAGSTPAQASTITSTAAVRNEANGAINGDDDGESEPEEEQQQQQQQQQGEEGETNPPNVAVSRSRIRRYR